MMMGIFFSPVSVHIDVLLGGSGESYSPVI